MARNKSDVLITQSLLDRLTDLDQWPETRSASITMYRESLKRDVEWLLNTRQPVIPELEGYPATAASVLNYGLPDIHSFDGSARQRTECAHRCPLKNAFASSSPASVSLMSSSTRTDVLSRSLKFHIEGQIVYENMNEEIKFDTTLELISGEYEVK